VAIQSRKDIGAVQFGGNEISKSAGEIGVSSVGEGAPIPEEVAGSILGEGLITTALLIGVVVGSGTVGGEGVVRGSLTADAEVVARVEGEGLLSGAMETPAPSGEMTGSVVTGEGVLAGALLEHGVLFSVDNLLGEGVVTVVITADIAPPPPPPETKFQFDTREFPPLIRVVDGVTSFTGNELYSAATDFADEPTSMSFRPPLDANGFFPLGGGIRSDAIYRILEPWRLKPYDGTYTLTILGTVITDGGILLTYDTQTVAFSTGEHVVGQTSGASGTIIDDTVPTVGDGILTVVDVQGTFVNGETIIGADGGQAVIAANPSETTTEIFVPPDDGNVVISVIAGSAGTVAFSEEVNTQSFLGRVWLDISAGLAGTAFPRGTPSNPVNNFPNAITIAAARGLDSYHLVGTLIFSPSSATANTNWLGSSPSNSIMVCTGNSLDACVLERVAITGAASGMFTGTSILLQDVSLLEGSANDSFFLGTLTINPEATQDIVFSKCYSAIAGTNTPILDCAGANIGISIRDYTGGLEIRNFTQGDMTIDVAQGNIILDSSCTGGTIVVRGVIDFTDNSNGSKVVTEGAVIAKTLMDSGEPYGRGTVSAAVTPTSTSCSTDLTESDTDHWKDAFIRFTSGALSGQIKLVTGYSSSNGVLVYEAFTQAPSNGDTFILLNS
jgi:hypothetical protein